MPFAGDDDFCTGFDLRVVAVYDEFARRGHLDLEGGIGITQTAREVGKFGGVHPPLDGGFLVALLDGRVVGHNARSTTTEVQSIARVGISHDEPTRLAFDAGADAILHSEHCIVDAGGIDGDVALLAVDKVALGRAAENPLPLGGSKLGSVAQATLFAFEQYAFGDVEVGHRCHFGHFHFVRGSGLLSIRGGDGERDVVSSESVVGRRSRDGL